jgi:hypothetical protein
LLRRIPAVNWVFTKLWPSPQGDSIGDAPIAADEAQALVVDLTEASPTADTGTAASHDDAEIAATVLVALAEAVAPEVEDSPSAAPSDTSANEEASRDTPDDIDPVAVTEPSTPSVEIESEPVEIADPISSRDASPESADVEPVVADDCSVPLADALSPAAESSDFVVAGKPSAEVAADIEPVSVDDAPMVLVEAESPAAEISDLVVASEPSPEVAAETESVSIDDTPIAPVEAESTAAEIPDLVVASEPSPEAAAETESVSIDDTPIAPVEAESPTADISDLVVAGEPSPEAAAETEPVNFDDAPMALIEAESATAEISDLIASEPSPEATVETEPVSVDNAPMALVEVESPTAEIPDLVVASDPSPSVAADVTPIPAEDPSPAVTAEEVPTVSSEAGAISEPAPVALPSAPKHRRTPKTPTRAADPADRVTLIRQRWAETGIRMWNPRLHGTGDATLNIQGRSELLPPEPGETMPRYDRLEFKMLGGQILCEGVIVEAPVQAGHRSFTRLAEPRSHDRIREPVRERQAALA